MSVRVLAVIVAAIWSPAVMFLLMPVTVSVGVFLVTVKVSVDTLSTLTISALVIEGCSPAGQTVALKGGSGKSAPSPDWTIIDVPPVPGELVKVE
jgi:hypothetical protein